MKKIKTQIASCLAMTLLSACMVRDPIQMKQQPLRLVQITSSRNNTLLLEWSSMDEKIRIETEEPIEDSNDFHAGMIYGYCFLPR